MVNFNFTGQNLKNLYPSIFNENDAEVKNFSSNEVKNHELADKMAGPQGVGKSPLGIGGFLKNDGIKGSEAFWEKLFGNNLNQKVDEFCNSEKLLIQPLTFNYYTNEFDDFVSSVFLAFSWNNDDNTLLIKRIYFEPKNQEQKADYFRVKCSDDSQEKDIDKIKRAITFFTKKTIDDEENKKKHRSSEQMKERGVPKKGGFSIEDITTGANDSDDRDREILDAAMATPGRGITEKDFAWKMMLDNFLEKHDIQGDKEKRPVILFLSHLARLHTTSIELRKICEGGRGRPLAEQEKKEVQAMIEAYESSYNFLFNKHNEWKKSLEKFDIFEDLNGFLGHLETITDLLTPDEKVKLEEMTLSESNSEANQPQDLSNAAQLVDDTQAAARRYVSDIEKSKNRVQDTIQHLNIRSTIECEPIEPNLPLDKKLEIVNSRLTHLASMLGTTGWKTVDVLPRLDQVDYEYLDSVKNVLRSLPSPDDDFWKEVATSKNNEGTEVMINFQVIMDAIPSAFFSDTMSTNIGAKTGGTPWVQNWNTSDGLVENGGMMFGALHEFIPLFTTLSKMRMITHKLFHHMSVRDIALYFNRLRSRPDDDERTDFYRPDGTYFEGILDLDFGNNDEFNEIVNELEEKLKEDIDAWKIDGTKFKEKSFKKHSEILDKLGNNKYIYEIIFRAKVCDHADLSDYENFAASEYNQLIDENDIREQNELLECIAEQKKSLTPGFCYGAREDIYPQEKNGSNQFHKAIAAKISSCKELCWITFNWKYQVKPNKAAGYNGESENSCLCHQFNSKEKRQDERGGIARAYGRQEKQGWWEDQFNLAEHLLIKGRRLSTIIDPVEREQVLDELGLTTEKLEKVGEILSGKNISAEAIIQFLVDNPKLMLDYSPEIILADHNINPKDGDHEWTYYNGATNLTMLLIHSLFRLQPNDENKIGKKSSVLDAELVSHPQAVADIFDLLLEKALKTTYVDNANDTRIHALANILTLASQLEERYHKLNPTATKPLLKMSLTDRKAILDSLNKKVVDGQLKPTKGEKFYLALTHQQNMLEALERGQELTNDDLCRMVINKALILPTKSSFSVPNYLRNIVCYGTAKFDSYWEKHPKQAKDVALMVAKEVEKDTNFIIDEKALAGGGHFEVTPLVKKILKNKEGYLVDEVVDEEDSKEHGEIKSTYQFSILPEGREGSGLQVDLLSGKIFLYGKAYGAAKTDLPTNTEIGDVFTGSYVIIGESAESTEKKTQTVNFQGRIFTVKTKPATKRNYTRFWNFQAANRSSGDERLPGFGGYFDAEISMKYYKNDFYYLTPDQINHDILRYKTDLNKAKTERNSLPDPAKYGLGPQLPLWMRSLDNTVWADKKGNILVFKKGDYSRPLYWTEQDPIKKKTFWHCRDFPDEIMQIATPIRGEIPSIGDPDLDNMLKNFEDPSNQICFCDKNGNPKRIRFSRYRMENGQPLEIVKRENGWFLAGADKTQWKLAVAHKKNTQPPSVTKNGLAFENVEHRKNQTRMVIPCSDDLITRLGLENAKYQRVVDAENDDRDNDNRYVANLKTGFYSQPVNGIRKVFYVYSNQKNSVLQPLEKTEREHRLTGKDLEGKLFLANRCIFESIESEKEKNPAAAKKELQNAANYLTDFPDPKRPLTDDEICRFLDIICFRESAFSKLSEKEGDLKKMRSAVALLAFLKLMDLLPANDPRRHQLEHLVEPKNCNTHRSLLDSLYRDAISDGKSEMPFMKQLFSASQIYAITNYAVELGNMSPAGDRLVAFCNGTWDEPSQGMWFSSDGDVDKETGSRLPYWKKRMEEEQQEALKDLANRSVTKSDDAATAGIKISQNSAESMEKIFGKKIFQVMTSLDQALDGNDSIVGNPMKIDRPAGEKLTPEEEAIQDQLAKDIDALNREMADGAAIEAKIQKYEKNVLDQVKNSDLSPGKMQTEVEASIEQLKVKKQEFFKNLKDRKVTTRDAIKAFLLINKNGEHNISNVAKFLGIKDTEAKEIIKITAEFMATSASLKQLRRIKKNLQAIEDGAEDEKIVNENWLKIANAVNQMNQASKEPLFLACSYVTGFYPRPEQIVAMKSLLNAAFNENPEKQAVLMQLLMGSGKTKYILPFILLLLDNQQSGEKKRIPIIVSHRSQMATVEGDLTTMLKEEYGMNLTTIRIDNSRIGDLKNLQSIRNKLVDALAKTDRDGQAFLIDSSNLEALYAAFNRYSQCLSTDETEEARTENLQRLEVMSEIFTLMKENGIGIFDEVDKTLSPRESFITPCSSTRSQLSEKDLGTIQKIFSLLGKNKNYGQKLRRGELKDLSAAENQKMFSELADEVLEQLDYFAPGLKAKLDKDPTLKSDLKKYILGDDEAFRGEGSSKKILEFINSQTGDDKNSICLLRGLLSQYLPRAFGLSFNENFGYDQEGKCVPFKGPNEPSTNIFKDPYEAACKTFCCVAMDESMGGGVPEAAIRKFVQNVAKERVLKDEEKAKTYFQEVFGSVLGDETLIDYIPPLDNAPEADFNAWNEKIRKLTARINSNETGDVRWQIAVQCAQKNIGYNSSTYEGKSTPLPEMFGAAIAFSGTVSNADAYSSVLNDDEEKKISDKGAIGRIFNKIEKDIESGKSDIIFADVDSISMNDLYDKISNENDKAVKPSALIDTGAFMKYSPAENVAREMLNCQPDLSGMVYFDPDKRSFFYMKRDQEKPIKMSTTNVQDLVKAGVIQADEAQKYGAYFDQPRTTGTDFQFPAEAHFWITVDPAKTTIDSFAQGAFRARQLLTTQSLDIIVLKSSACKLVGGEDVVNMESKKEQWKHIVQTLQRNSTMEIVHQEIQGAEDKLENIIRSYIANAEVKIAKSNLSKEDKIQILKELNLAADEFVITHDDFDPVAMFGGIQDWKNVKDYLNEIWGKKLKIFSERIDGFNKLLNGVDFKEVVGGLVFDREKANSEAKKIINNVPEVKILTSYSDEASTYSGSNESKEMEVELQQEKDKNLQRVQDLEENLNPSEKKPYKEKVWNFDGPNKEKCVDINSVIKANSKNIVIQSISQVISNNKAFANVGHPPYNYFKKCFPGNIKMTSNFQRTCENEPNQTVFSSLQKTANYMLVKWDDEYKNQEVIFVSAEEANSFRDAIDNKKINNCAICLVAGTSISNEKIPEKVQKTVQAGRLWAEVFNGQIHGSALSDEDLVAKCVQELCADKKIMENQARKAIIDFLRQKNPNTEEVDIAVSLNKYLSSGIQAPNPEIVEKLMNLGFNKKHPFNKDNLVEYIKKKGLGADLKEMLKELAKDKHFSSIVLGALTDDQKDTIGIPRHVYSNNNNNDNKNKKENVVKKPNKHIGGNGQPDSHIGGNGQPDSHIGGNGQPDSHIGGNRQFKSADSSKSFKSVGSSRLSNSRGSTFQNVQNVSPRTYFQKTRTKKCGLWNWIKNHSVVGCFMAAAATVILGVTVGTFFCGLISAQVAGLIFGLAVIPAFCLAVSWIADCSELAKKRQEFAQMYG